MIRATAKPLRTLWLGFLASGIAACGEPPTPPEQALRAWVATGQRLVEAQDRSGLMDMIADNYTDARGNDRNAIDGLFRFYFLRAHGIKLFVSIEELRVFSDSAAEIDLQVGMGATHDGVLGFSAEAYDFKLELVRDGDDWLLLSARWGERGADIR